MREVVEEGKPHGAGGRRGGGCRQRRRGAARRPEAAEGPRERGADAGGRGCPGRGARKRGAAASDRGGRFLSAGQIPDRGGCEAGEPRAERPGSVPVALL